MLIDSKGILEYISESKRFESSIQSWAMQQFGLTAEETHAKLYYLFAIKRINRYWNNDEREFIYEIA